ncbi:MAG: hypothetical protein ACK41T_03665 [Pseudobdellovibrio sp.]
MYKKKKSNSIEDQFIDSLKIDEEVAHFEMTNRTRDRKAKYRLCPHCGSRSWNTLFSDDYGRTTCCNECKASYNTPI